jgi:glutamine amidotransferase
VWQGAIGACQFHPEKSGQAGTDLLQRWLRWLAERQHQQGGEQQP